MDTSWFRNAGLGMFIHWGMFSVHGRGEWCPYQEQIPIREYDERYMDLFTADEYDPELWAQYAVRAGMKYMTLTTKHHDGFCLFDTKTTDRNAVKRGPKRDLVRPFVEACRKYGLKCGLYFSLPDWNVPAFMTGPHLTPKEWGEFLDTIVFPQVRELCTNYGKIDMIWYDNIVGMSNGKESFEVNTNFREASDTTPNEKLTAEDYRSRELNAMIRELQPDIILVAMGVPKQEMWIHEHLQDLPGCVAIGVGGLLDFVSERIPRSPLWMRECGMEWCYRLYNEPIRLFKRYIIGNPLFIARVFLSKLWRGK